MVLSPVRRPVKTLDYVLLKDRDLPRHPDRVPKLILEPVFGCHQEPHPEKYCISSQNSRSPSPAFLLLCLGPVRGGTEVGNRKSDSNEIVVIL